jgi:hypothetical protein
MLCRALDEMQRACQAAVNASREAEASSSASAAALQEQLLKVRQLQAQLDTLSMRHSMEMQAAQQLMREQVCGWLTPRQGSGTLHLQLVACIGANRLHAACWASTLCACYTQKQPLLLRLSTLMLCFVYMMS